MKKTAKTVILLLLAIGILYLATWLMACKGTSEDEVNVTKQIIEKSSCVQSTYLFKFQKDDSHKEFGYTVETKSGAKVNLWFDTSTMDVSKVCYKPVGLGVNLGDEYRSQVYTIEYLNEVLKEKNVKITDLNDVLCNCSELLQLFQKNYENRSSPKIENASLINYLQIYFQFSERPIVD